MVPGLTGTWPGLRWVCASKLCTFPSFLAWLPYLRFLVWKVYTFRNSEIARSVGRFKKVGFDFLAGDVGPGHGVHIHTRTRTWANCVISTDCRLAGVPQPLHLLKIAERKKNFLQLMRCSLSPGCSLYSQFFFFPISKLLKFLFVIDTQQGETFRIITYMRSTCTDGYTEVYIPVWRCLVYNWATSKVMYGSPGEPGGGGLGG